MKKMQEFLTVLINNGWKAAIPFFVVLFFQGILLVSSNRLESITLSAKQRMTRKIVKIVLLSSISTMILTIIIFVVNRKELMPILLFFMVSVFITYAVLLIIFLPWLEKNGKTYFYINDDEKGVLFVQGQTVNKQIILTSTPNVDSKTSEGFVLFVDEEYLLNKKIYFVSPKKKNWFIQYRLDPATIITGATDSSEQGQS
jgi:hypothetical protein